MKPIIILATLTGALASVVKLPNAARMIDPATMDPTRLSVLSVLKTAIPTSSNTPIPTGDYEPVWYQKLPGDVKSLLPALYPVTTIATSEVGVSQTPGSAMSTDATIYAPAPTASAPTASALTLYSGLVPNSTVLASGSDSLVTASASSTSFLSAGARGVVRTETLAVVAWVGVGAGFFLFA